MKRLLTAVAIALPLLASAISHAETGPDISFTFSAERKPRLPRPPRPFVERVRFEDPQLDWDDNDTCYEHSLQGSADSTFQFLDIEGDYSEWQRANAAARVLICDPTERTASFD